MVTCYQNNCYCRHEAWAIQWLLVTLYCNHYNHLATASWGDVTLTRPIPKFFVPISHFDTKICKKKYGTGLKIPKLSFKWSTYDESSAPALPLFSMEESVESQPSVDATLGIADCSDFPPFCCAQSSNNFNFDPVWHWPFEACPIRLLCVKF